jgi:zinc/manganese transport system substrate-binding protein
MRRCRRALPAVLLLATLPATWGADAPRKLVVSLSTVVNDMVAHIGGDRITAVCILTPGVDPHTYQPTPEDARQLARADLVIANGLGFEGWSDALIHEAGYRGRVALASSGVAALPIAGPEAGTSAAAAVPDPHAFNDLANGVLYAQNIEDALIALDPANQQDYAAWGQIYIARLRLLEGWVRQQLALVPPSQRILVTDHDALQYFAKAYGFTVIAPNTALEEAQPGSHALVDLIGIVRAHALRTIFLERGHSPKLVEQIAREAQVTIGGDLFLDGVAGPSELAGTYEGMFLANVRTIVRGLK